MPRFIRWLEDEAGWKDVPRYVLSAILAILLLATLGRLILLFLTTPVSHAHTFAFGNMNFLEFINRKPPHSIMEEIIFRAPLSIFALYGGSSLIIPLALFSSVLFGLMHGNLSNIAAQGVGGLVFSVLFLKFGGMQGKFYKPLTISSTTHLLWNILTFALLHTGLKWIIPF